MAKARMLIMMTMLNVDEEKRQPVQPVPALTERLRVHIELGEIREYFVKNNLRQI
jgi:hypothetical protein